MFILIKSGKFGTIWVMFIREIRIRLGRFFRKFRLLDLLGPKYLKYTLVGIGAIILAIIVLILLGTPTGVEQGNDIEEKNYVSIAICSSNEKFGKIDPANKIVGFEREIIDGICDIVFPGIDRGYTFCEAQTASYLLRSGEVDLVIGMMTSGVAKTSGLSLSAPYYYDKARIYLPGMRKNIGVAQLTGTSLDIMTTDIKRSDVVAYFDAERIVNISFINSTSYPDAIYSIENQRHSALVAPFYHMESYLALSPHEAELFRVGYSVCTYGTNKLYLPKINDAIATLKNDGVVRRLCVKYIITPEN